MVISHEQIAALPRDGGFFVDPEAIGRVPEALALRYDVLPLTTDNDELAIAVIDPDDREIIDRVRLATGMRVRAVAASRESIRQHLSVAYSVIAPGAGGRHSDGVRAIETLQSTVERAIQRRTSDIHFEPSQARTRVRFRIDGVLSDDETLDRELGERVVARIKLLAGMDIADRRLPQDGRCTFSAVDRSIDARVSSMPTIYGEKIVIRLLNAAAGMPRLADLGMSATILDRFGAVLRASHGLIVVCGPTGSGKTTTLYASLLERSSPDVQVCTIEDPVELQLPGIVQVQVNERTGLTFASAIRAMVRQDPDIVMIGEMRDSETAQAAISAALAGRLVLTTLHCVDAPAAIDRIAEFGVSRSVLAHTLAGVLSQRLLRCDGPIGALGRTGVFEYLPLDESVRVAIADSRGQLALREFAGALGYVSLRAQAAELVQNGIATYREVRRVLGDAYGE